MLMFYNFEQKLDKINFKKYKLINFNHNIKIIQVSIILMKNLYH